MHRNGIVLLAAALPAAAHAQPAPQDSGSIL